MATSAEMGRSPEPRGAVPPTRRWGRRLGVSLLLVTAIAGGLWVWSLRLRASAEAYARQATSDVTTDWAPESLAARASASLLERTPADAIAKYLTFIRGQLGRLVDIGGVEATGATVALGSVTVTVRVAAVFEKGHGLVSWVLLKDGASWKVASVAFDSDQIHLPVQGQSR